MLEKKRITIYQTQTTDKIIFNKYTRKDNTQAHIVTICQTLFSAPTFYKYTLHVIIQIVITR